MPTKKAKLRGQADKLWYLKHLQSRCEFCNQPAIQVHHFYPKGLYGHLRYDEDNAVSLCMGCHFSHHHKGDPAIHEIIKVKRGKAWFNRLQKKSREKLKPSYLTIKHYKDKIEELQ